MSAYKTILHSLTKDLRRSQLVQKISALVPIC